ncbi:MAG: hypothetical protein ABIC19_02725 [Patescibacteria group bacterium]
MKKKTFDLFCLPSVKNIKQITDKFLFPINLTKGKYQDLEFIFQDNNPEILYNGVNLNCFSFVWLSSFWGCRDLAYAIGLYLDKFETPRTPVEKSTSKITDHMIFSLNNIQAPNTLFFNRHNIEKNLAQIERVCGYPLIIKDIRGSRGSYSAYAATEKELIRKMKKLPKHRKYLFQKYIPNEYDWGVLVADGVIVSGEKSYPSNGEFRNNVCNGAREVFVDSSDIPSKIKEMALKISSALGLSWARADIIVDKNTKKPYLLEVNRFPGITSGTSEVDGGYRFLSSKINHLLEKMNLKFQPGKNI